MQITDWPDEAALAVIRAFTSVLSPAGPRGRLSVLIYHRVLQTPDPMRPAEPDETSFRWQMRLMRQHFNVLSLSEAIQRLKDGTLPARAASITFDDGYADNFSIALPVLERFGLPATFFIASGYLNEGRMWNDTIIEAVRRAPDAELDLRQLGLDRLSIATPEQRHQASIKLINGLMHLPQVQRQRQVDAIAGAVGADLPSDLMMPADQVHALAAAGMEIGAHTVSHPILRSLTNEQATKEINSSRQRLTEITGKTVSLFAYPNGKPGRDYDARHVALVRDLGFLGAVSTAWGASGRGTDCFQLPRFTPWDQTPTRFFAQLLLNYLRASKLTASPRGPGTTAPAS
jgi:peptidoglycan/xylan/chitin deacetylase (PgdA/CDA1 family)